MKERVLNAVYVTLGIAAMILFYGGMAVGDEHHCFAWWAVRYLVKSLFN